MSHYPDYQKDLTDKIPLKKISDFENHYLRKYYFSNQISEQSVIDFEAYDQNSENSIIDKQKAQFQNLGKKVIGKNSNKAVIFQTKQAWDYFKDVEYRHETADRQRERLGSNLSEQEKNEMESIKDREFREAKIRQNNGHPLHLNKNGQIPVSSKDNLLKRKTYPPSCLRIHKRLKPNLRGIANLQARKQLANEVSENQMIQKIIQNLDPKNLENDYSGFQQYYDVLEGEDKMKIVEENNENTDKINSKDCPNFFVNKVFEKSKNIPVKLLSEGQDFAKPNQLQTVKYFSDLKNKGLKTLQNDENYHDENIFNDPKDFLYLYDPKELRQDNKEQANLSNLKLEDTKNFYKNFAISPFLIDLHHKEAFTNDNYQALNEKELIYRICVLEATNKMDREYNENHNYKSSHKKTVNAAINFRRNPLKVQVIYITGSNFLTDLTDEILKHCPMHNEPLPNESCDDNSNGIYSAKRYLNPEKYKKDQTKTVLLKPNQFQNQSTIKRENDNHENQMIDSGNINFYKDQSLENLVQDNNKLTVGDIFKDNFYVIEDNIYSDERDIDRNNDLSINTKKHILENINGKTEFGQKIIEKYGKNDITNWKSQNQKNVRIKDLDQIRVGFPYLFQYQGSFEKIVVFDDVRFLNVNTDVLCATRYPFTVKDWGFW